MSDKRADDSSDVLEYRNPNTTGVRGQRGDMQLAFAATAYACVVAIYALPRTSYYEPLFPREWIASGVFVMIAATGWLDYQPGRAITPRRIIALAAIVFGVTLMIVYATRQLRIHVLDSGYPQPRWRWSLMRTQTLVATALGLALAIIGIALRASAFRRDQTSRTFTP